MIKAKVAVLVSGGGTNLQALIDAENSGIIKSGELSLVVSNNSDAYALCRAEKAGIKSVVISKKQYKEKFEYEIISTLEENGIDFIVLAGFMCILSEKFTSHFKDRIINVHPSLIPSFCGKGFYGLHVHEAALEYGVKVTGATVHFVNEIPDGGKIIMQKAVSIMEGDTPEILQKRVMEEAEWKILPLALEKVCFELISNKGD
ncbi:MAG: phosphoribosylglycinamide formyltransferase [Oscillospiraceae bacterium]|nr:phosphoribosylglycinamide formyltransferase [Oscillospiraceae bacterium]